MHRTAFAIAAVLLGAACSMLPGGARVGRAGIPRDSILVHVLNENYYEARIHAVYEGAERHSLGTVPGNGGRARVAFPWQPRAVEFAVFFITAGTTYRSDPFDISPGDSVELRVPQNISTSGFFRRVGE